ncbi:Coiled-coil domain-containing protein 57 [Chytridiales sp. JEL 0842]|nr:Coiled-coil domain-containing protein 57 [Chytridiales sp. JEL 0842]
MPEQNSSAMPGSLEVVEALLQDRDQKLRDLYAGLDLAIKQKSQEYEDTKLVLQNLKEDFVFNLRLIEERDLELERFEALGESLKKELYDRDATISELKILLSDRCNELANVKALLQTQEHQHAEVVRKLRNEHEIVAQNYENHLKEKDTNFSNVQLSLENRLKSAERELEALRAGEKKSRDLQWEQEDTIRSLKGQILNLEQELKQCSTTIAEKDVGFESQRMQLIIEYESKEKMKDSEITRLRQALELSSSKNEECRQDLQSQRERYQRDISALETLLGEKTDQIERQSLETSSKATKILELEAKLALEVECHNEKLSRIQMMHADEINVIHTGYRQEIETLRTNLAAGEKTLCSLKIELEERLSDIDALKQDIMRRMEYESEMKALIVEQNLAWETKCRDIKRSKQREQEKMLKGVMKEKNSLLAELKLLRDSARKQMVQDNMLPQRFAGENDMAFDETPYAQRISELESENEQLQNLIKLMRQDMERIQAAFSQKNDQIHEPMQDRNEASIKESLGFHQQLQSMNELLQRKQATIDALLASQERLPRSTQLNDHNIPAPVFAISENTDLQNQLRALVNENNMFRDRLKDTITELSVAASEKARLLDISNGLRATIRRYEDASKHQSSKGTQTAAVNRARSQDAKRPFVTTGTVSSFDLKPPEDRSSLIKVQPEKTKPIRKPTTASSLDPKEIEKARRAKGVRNWNEMEDI